jgi:hypothetical protein
MERSAIRGSCQADRIPDFAALHPGYDKAAPTYAAVSTFNTPRRI